MPFAARWEKSLSKTKDNNLVRHIYSWVPSFNGQTKTFTDKYLTLKSPSELASNQFLK